MARVSVAVGLVVGAAADELFADPRRGHPVAAYGAVVSAVEARLYADSRVRGGWFVFAVTVPLLIASVGIERLVRRRSVVHGVVIAAATWTVLGGTSLTRVGRRMSQLLADDDLPGARKLLPSLCGRDPGSLDDAGLARATVESIAENSSDAAVAPLVWGALAGLPGLVLYRALNTLDAMVGHRSPRYARFGSAAARLDDVANLVPARVSAALTLLAAPVVDGSARAGWDAWRRDARRHPSPNAGCCEAAAAGVLGVRLGGVTIYAGRAEQRPALGSGVAPRVDDIERCVRLSRTVVHLAVGLCAGLAWLDRRPA